MLAKLKTPYKTWWIYLWGVVAVALIVSLFFVPFAYWSVAAFVCFGTLEGIGVFVRGPYPPLTDVIRLYVPMWASIPVIWLICAGAGATWFHWPHPLGVSLLAGLLGWFQNHFIRAYYAIGKF